MLRTPAQIEGWLADNLHRFDLPTQYAGDEPNARRTPWDAATLRWCLLASWPYEQAAGNSSIPAVYACVNDAGYLADRFYLPATPRDFRLLERADVPIFGIESKHPITDFDVVGTSISYPVLSMSFVKMLTHSGIPARWADRDPNTTPMIIVGGQSYGVPEVLAPVADCWWLGEVEDEPGNPGIAAVCAHITALKAMGRWTRDRIGCYAELARTYRFLYFPRFVEVHYDYLDRGLPEPSKQVVAVTSTLPGMRLPLLKRFVRDLDAVAPLAAPPLLYADPAMGSGDLEVARGCPAWCSFCALTFRAKPYRQRSVDKVVEYAKDMHDNMGAVRMAPFSPDFPMFTERKRLISRLLTDVSDEVDAPTMRADDFIADHEFITLQVAGGMDAVTLGVEGNSQRMRDLVGKGTSDEDIREAVTRGIRAGIRKFKLFMISNLPGEDDGDVVRILHLARDLADIREQLGQPGVRIQFSWTPLLVEGNTPFQWFEPTLSSRILGDVCDSLRELKIQFKMGAKAEPNRLTFFQLAQRASRHVGEALVDAMCATGQACWGGVPRDFADTLDEALRRHGFANGIADCFDERDRADMFGWEHIDQGIAAGLLWTTYLQMREFVEHTDSATYDEQVGPRHHGNEWLQRCDERCYGTSCGVCTHADLRLRQRYLVSRDADVDLARLPVIDQRSQALRVRVRIDKPDHSRFVGNDHWRFALRRAAYRAQRRLGLPYGIAKRSIVFASDHIKDRDWTCGVDYVEFGLTRAVSEREVRDFLAVLALHLQDWLIVYFTQFRVLSARQPTMRAGIDLSLFELDLDEPPEQVHRRVEAFRTSPHVPMQLKLDGGYFAPAAEQVNARDYVDDLWLVADGHELALRMLVRGRPSPYQVYAAVMGRASWIDAAARPARRVEAFIDTDRRQQDFLRPSCLDCGLLIPTTVLDRPWDRDRCPRCRDRHTHHLWTPEGATA